MFGFSRAIRASNGKSSLHRIYKNNDFAYAVIGLIKITARNEKALTARGTAWKFLHGPKHIFPGSGPGWPGCGYVTAWNTARYQAEPEFSVIPAKAKLA